MSAKKRAVKAGKHTNEQYEVSRVSDDSASHQAVNSVNELQLAAGYVTLGIGSHRIMFECDTGSQCNILPLNDYTLATGDTTA